MRNLCLKQACQSRLHTQSLGLVCEYSEDVTEEEIAQTDADGVKADEWGIISLKPFEHDSFEVDSTNANKRTGPFTVSSTEGIILEGLIPGEYQIEEKTAPNGYIITLEPFTVTLNGDGTVTPSDTSGVLVVPLPKDNNNPAGLQIGNDPGAALPSTGGPGTRLFTILGLILIAGAGLLLLRRRRTI